MGVSGAPDHDLSLRDLDEMLVAELARSDTAVGSRALAVGLSLELVEDWLRSAKDRGLVTETTDGRWELTVPGYRYYA